MLKRLLVLCTALFASFFFVPDAQAQTPSPQQLLQDMSQAHQERDFRGRLVYVRGNDVSTLEVLRGRIDGQEYERLTHLDGELAELIRHGEQLVCVHADKTITRLGGRAGIGPFALQAQLSTMIPKQYRIEQAGPDRVAGRATWRLHLVPQDEYRYGYRLWIDDDSHLLLRSELIGAQGQVLERLEFISLELSPTLTLEQFRIPAAAQEQAINSVESRDHPQGRLQFVTQWLPEGFIATEQDMRMKPGGQSPVSSRAYSDGLAAFTLFLERATEDAVVQSVSHMGPTLAVTRQLGEAADAWLVTLVGEVPPSTAERVLNALLLEERLLEEPLLKN